MSEIISLVTLEILEAKKSDLFQCTLGEAHAVIAVCWIESLLPYTYKQGYSQGNSLDGSFLLQRCFVGVSGLLEFVLQ